MTDRELLELAAKAIGATEYEGPDDCRLPGIVLMRGVPTQYEGHGEFGCDWNPLEDDGDALRLAGVLAIDIERSLGFVAAKWWEKPMHQMIVTESTKADPYAATRRAIVRAAAEIGANP